MDLSPLAELPLSTRRALFQTLRDSVALTYLQSYVSDMMTPHTQFGLEAKKHETAMLV